MPSPQPPSPGPLPRGDREDGVRAAKRALRATVLARREARSEAERASYGEQLATVVLDQAEVRRAACVAAYVGVGAEPATLPLLDALTTRGVRVLLPLLGPGFSMTWGVYGGHGDLVTTDRGLREPTGEPEPDGLAAADVVLLPGLAMSPTGMRLGRGGGAYDRALADLPSDGTAAPLLVLLHDDEVGLDVPSEAHDLPVHAALTGAGRVDARH